MSKREFSLSQQEYDRDKKRLKTLSQNYEQNTSHDTSKDDLEGLKRLLPNLVKPEEKAVFVEERNTQSLEDLASKNLSRVDENGFSQPDLFDPLSPSRESACESGADDSVGDFIPPPSSPFERDDDSVGDFIPLPATRVISSGAIENTNVQRR